MSKDFSEVAIKDTVNIAAEQVPDFMPVEAEEQDTVKIRKRRTRSEIEAGLTLDEINGLKATDKKEEERLQESVDRVVNQMQKNMGLPKNLNSMISKQQLDEWKLSYGELYRSYLNGQDFIWHKIRRKDYVALMTDSELSALDNAELRVFLRQEKITKMCVLYPDKNTLDNIVENNAGVAGNISDEIMMISGFRPISSEQIS